MPGYIIVREKNQTVISGKPSEFGACWAWFGRGRDRPTTPTTKLLPRTQYTPPAGSALEAFRKNLGRPQRSDLYDTRPAAVSILDVGRRTTYVAARSAHRDGFPAGGMQTTFSTAAGARFLCVRRCRRAADQTSGLLRNRIETNASWTTGGWR